MGGNWRAWLQIITRFSLLQLAATLTLSLHSQSMFVVLKNGDVTIFVDEEQDETVSSFRVNSIVYVLRPPRPLALPVPA